MGGTVMLLFTLHNLKFTETSIALIPQTSHCRSRKVRRIVSSYETSIMQLILMKKVLLPGSHMEAISIYVS